MVCKIWCCERLAACCYHFS